MTFFYKGCPAGENLIVSGTTYECVNMLTDPSNCGKGGSICAGPCTCRSYFAFNYVSDTHSCEIDKSAGMPVCIAGTCGMDCPVSTQVISSGNDQSPLSCV